MTLLNHIPNIRHIFWGMIQPAPYKQPSLTKQLESALNQHQPADELLNNAFHTCDLTCEQSVKELKDALKIYQNYLLLRDTSPWVHLARSLEQASAFSYALEDDARLLEHGIEFSLLELKYGLKPTVLSQEAKEILTPETLAWLVRCYNTQTTDSQFSALEQARVIVKGFSNTSDTQAADCCRGARTELAKILSSIRRQPHSILAPLNLQQMLTKLEANLANNFWRLQYASQKEPSTHHRRPSITFAHHLERQTPEADTSPVSVFYFPTPTNTQHVPHATT